jgi:ferrous iron transport protein B
MLIHRKHGSAVQHTKPVKERLGCDFVVAVAGSPNVGKTTLYNVLTRAAELVANWPGATVDIKYGRIRVDSATICLVDLPGTYSINGTGPEEAIARDFLLYGKPDAIIVLADSTNLERTLLLPIELLELFDRVIVVLTKIDEAERRGIIVNTKKLSSILGVPVVSVSALHGDGIDELKRTLLGLLRGEIAAKSRIRVVIPKDYSRLHDSITSVLAECKVEERVAKWIAIQAIAGAEWVWDLVEHYCGSELRQKLTSKINTLLGKATSDKVALALTIEKYNLISRMYSECVSMKKGSFQESEAYVAISRLDALFLHPLLGPLASLAMLLALFVVSFSIALGTPLDIVLEYMGYSSEAELVAEYSLVSITAKLMDKIAETVSSMIDHPVLSRLVGEGVLSSSYGVGLVVSFLPLVGVFMALIAAFEDSGLAPRIASGFDKIFKAFGVSGKAVFPMILSFGCNVPGTVSTRIMESNVERLALIQSIAFVPCTARYIVIVALATAYFKGATRAFASFAVYMIAVVTFLVSLKLLTLVKGYKPEDLLLELPPLKKPSFRVIWWLTWSKVKEFLVRAGTIILIASVVLWVLTNYGPEGYIGLTGNVADSYAAKLGSLLSPYVEFLVDVNRSISWRIAYGFMAGFIAKEAFLEALAVVAPRANVSTTVAASLKAYGLTPVQAFTVLVAVTLYIPCLATVAAIYSESRSLKLTVASMVYTFSIATAVALAVRMILSLVI